MIKKFVIAIFITLVATGSYASAAIVGQWKFNEASGTTAIDSSGNGNNGTVYGGATLNGSGILTLDGTNDYVSLPIGSVISSLNSCTIAVWVDFFNSGGSWQRIFDFGTGTAVNMFLTPRTTTTGPMRFAITTSGASGEQQLTAPSTLPSGPHLVVVRINAATDTGTLFLDGTAVATNNSMTLAPSNLGNTTRNWLGRSQYSADAYFNGSYDEFRIYNTALSDSEIAVLTNKNKASEPNPEDNATGVDPNADLSWAAGAEIQPVGGHDLYLGTDSAKVDSATRENHPDVDYYNLDQNFFDPGTFDADVTYYWRVDEVCLPTIWKGDVWNFTVQGLKASNPEPANEATDIGLLSLLGWKSGLGADRHNVFFSDSYNAVLNAECLYGDFDLDSNVSANDLSILATQWLGTCDDGLCADVDYNGEVNYKDFAYFANTWLMAGDGTYRGGLPADSNSFFAGLLSPGQTYYWRIDEVNFSDGIVAVGDVWSFTASSSGVFDLTNEYFQLQFNMSLGGFTDMYRTGDEFGTKFILGPADYSAYGKSNPGWLLGDILMKYRIGGGGWRNANTYVSDDNRQIAIDYEGQRAEIIITYPLPSGQDEGIRDFDVSQRWVLNGNSLSLDVNIVNTTGNTLEIGDLAFPLPFNSHYDGADTETIQKKRVLRHGFFSGHGSHSYWTRVNGVAPFLVMTTPSPDTRFEYWDNIANGDIYFKAYVHSLLVGGSTAGTWRQAHTSRVLQPDQSIELKFNFTWANSLNEVRDILYADNDLDIQCVPGMTIPQDLYALVKIRTKQVINSIQAEYPADTNILYVDEPLPDTHIYKVQFNRLGENIIKINHNGTQQTILEFFSTEPLETLIKKRASHLVNYQQVRDPSKWYDGLVGPWDMRYGVVRTPDNTDGFDGWWGYVIACDDPGLCHVPLVASKNVHYPVQSEIEACEYYIDNFVWGGLQRMDTESPNPWGIYGVPNWYEHRVLDPDPWATGRIYDYPHIVNLYYCMYEIAKKYPDMVSYLDKNGYLYRAYNTAIKYFNITSWVYEVGTMDELVILEVIDALREEGWYTEADALEAEWDTKVKYFIFDKEYPYGSEYAMDSTAFESSHALAKWAMENGLEPDPEHPVIDPERIEEFMHGQMTANLAVRGCIEPAFYTYGSDYRVWGQTRYTLSYMAQMGGWAVLDYGLNWTEQPIDYIRLGYGSYLSSWALMNSDPTGTNGYWHPGAANDGAIGWAFKPEKNGPIWLQGRYLERGIWYYDGEIDLGLGGALRTSRAVVVDDPVFGLFGYGCEVVLNGGNYEVVVKDGLREWLIMHNLGIELKLNRDSFAAGQNVVISEGKNSVSFVLDNERTVAHTTKLKVRGLIAGTYSVKINSVEQYTVSVSGPEDEKQLDMSIGTALTYNISVSKI